MKYVVAFAALVAIALAAPQKDDASATVLKNELNNIGVDGYSFAYETSNGISASETGTLENAGSENEAIKAQGEYTYQAPNGKTVKVTYEADENGWRPKVSIS